MPKKKKDGPTVGEPVNENENAEVEGFFKNRFRDFYELAGVPAPSDEAMEVDTLYVGLPPDDMSYKVAGHLRGKDLLFVREGVIGTIDRVSGEFTEMSSHRFVTWLPSEAGLIPFKKFDKDAKRPQKELITVDQAKLILSSDQVTRTLPIIRRINTVRLPVMRGSGELELLKPGYDAESETFTVSALKYDEKLDPHEAHRYLMDLLKHFGMDERSLSVQIAAMMTVYGVGLFHGRSPLFVWNSNLPGSGKSRLAQMAVQVIHPLSGASGFHLKDPNETRKEMDATAQEGGPVLWFDDVELPAGFELRSGDLNRWMTVKNWECRVMTTSKKVRPRLNCATFMTGTHLRLNDHLGRRALFVDIFSRQRSRDRDLPADAIVLDDAFFEDPAKRGRVLSCLWALVRWWDENKRPKSAAKKLASFEGWSEVIPGIVMSSEFGDCLARFDAPDAGEVTNREITDLVRAIVRSRKEVGETKGFYVRLGEIIRIARYNGLFQEELMSLEAVVALLETKHGWEWGKDVKLMAMAPDDVRILFAKQKAGMPLDEEQTAALYQYTVEGDPTMESKSQQAAEWRDKSIDGKFSSKFRSTAVAGQWFDVDGEIWQFGDRRDYRGSRFEVFKVEEQDADSGS